MSGSSTVSLVLQVAAVTAAIAGARSLACRPQANRYPKSLWVAATLWVLSVFVTTPACAWVLRQLSQMPTLVWIGLGVAYVCCVTMAGLGFRHFVAPASPLGDRGRR